MPKTYQLKFLRKKISFDTGGGGFSRVGVIFSKLSDFSVLWLKKSLIPKLPKNRKSD